MAEALARYSRTALLAVSIVLAMLFLALTALRGSPVETSGFHADGMTGRITEVRPNSPAWTAGVRPGDLMLDPPRGNPRRGFRLQFPSLGDRFRILTQRGVVSVAPMRLSPLDAPHHEYIWADMAADISVVVVLGFATLLYVRRPGLMAFSFWLSAASGWSYGQFSPLFHRIPHDVGVWIAPPVGGVIGFAFALPLIPFALRFPDDRVSARRARAERIAWACYGIAVLVGTWYYAVVVHGGGVIPEPVALAILYDVPAAPIPIAAAILIATYRRADPQRRAQTAWAVAGLLGSLLVTFAAANEEALSGALRISNFEAVQFFYSALSVAGNLLPLLAIYPILRFGLFDIGFVVSRATLYSVLTVAAFATLAGVNWIAQRLVNDRLASVLQPVAAIVIGLGYFRVRHWTKDAIEHVLFRERLAAEREIDALIAALPSLRSVAKIDETLTLRAAGALSLQSAALFRRAADGGFRRAASVGWDGATLDDLPQDSPLLQRLQRAERVASLRELEWSGHGEPGGAARPIAALALRDSDEFVGVVLYGRHANGTEIDPEELTLLRGLGDAAATAYEGAALRAEIADLRSQLATTAGTAS